MEALVPWGPRAGSGEAHHVRQNGKHPLTATKRKYVAGSACAKSIEAFDPREVSMPEPFVPDLSSRPFSMTVERQMTASAERIYDAWTKRFDKWFAQPGELVMTPEEGSLFFFYNRHDWGRHAHYGRFLELASNERVRMTWLTGAPGTYGDETVIEIELAPRKEGTLLRLTHSGFSTKEACKAHEDNWPAALETLDEALSK